MLAESVFFCQYNTTMEPGIPCVMSSILTAQDGCQLVDLLKGIIYTGIVGLVAN